MTPLKALPWSLCAGCVLALGAISTQVMVQGSSPTMLWPRSVVFAWIAGAAMVFAASGLLMRWASRAWPAIDHELAPGASAFAWGLNAGAVMLVIPAILLVWRFEADVVGGWTYPMLNKRWLVGLYYTAIAAILVLPFVFASIIRVPLRMRPEDVAGAPPRRWWTTIAGTIGVIAVAWFFAGPPWHMDRHHRPIDFHEQVHLGPLQAIDKGYLPFIGPATSQYGPGSQVATYAIMKAQGRFDVVSFRNAQAAQHFGAVILVGLVGLPLCGFWRTIAIVALAMAYSPLRFLFPLADGTMGGDYGWGNAWRYLGPLVVVPAVAMVAVNPSRYTRPFTLAAGLGVTWGVFSWIAQENLLSTGVAAALTLMLLGVTGTVTWNRVRIASAGLMTGWFAACLAVLVFYGLRGEAGTFVTNYFVVGSAVAMGFQNTWWTDGDGLRMAFYFTAPLMFAIALAILWDLGRVRPRGALDPGQVRLLSLVMVVLASFHTALYRSDGAHLMNTMIALPFVLVLAASDLPSWLAEGRLSQWGFRGALGIVALWLFPIGAWLTSPVETFLAPPLARFAEQPPAAVDQHDARIAFQRATVRLSNEPAVTTGGPAMREYLEFATALREVIGTRPVYVADTIVTYASLYYFIADLTPAPYLGDKETMIINSARLRDSLAHMRRHITQFRSVVTLALDSGEARVFLDAYPAAQVVKRSLQGRDVFILLADPERLLADPERLLAAQERPS